MVFLLSDVARRGPCCSLRRRKSIYMGGSMAGSNKIVLNAASTELEHGAVQFFQKARWHTR